jgi:hypothetical protein
MCYARERHRARWCICVSTVPKCLGVRRDRLRIVADIRILYQIFAFIGVVESFSYEKVFYGQPGDGNLGFDPLGMGKNPASLAYYKTAEIKNGRLAMIGFSGMLHHALITHKGPIDQIMSADFYPTTSTFQQTAGVYGY